MIIKQLLLITFIFFFVTNDVHGQTDNLKMTYPNINPTSSFYQIKRLWEKGRYFISFSHQNKVVLNESLLNERLAELKYVVDNKILSEIQTSSERFSQQVGVSGDDLKKFNDKDKLEKTINHWKNYSQLLSTLRDSFEANSSYWLLIQQNIDTISIISEKIKNN